MGCQSRQDETGCNAQGGEGEPAQEFGGGPGEGRASGQVLAVGKNPGQGRHQGEAGGQGEEQGQAGEGRTDATPRPEEEAEGPGDQNGQTFPVKGSLAEKSNGGNGDVINPLGAAGLGKLRRLGHGPDNPEVADEEKEGPDQRKARQPLPPGPAGGHGQKEANAESQTGPGA